jgi:biopolymer transport protein TolR
MPGMTLVEVRMASSLMGSGRSGSRNGRRRAGMRPMSDINVTPFVDVMLVLLIVFMVAAPLLTAGVPVDLPKSNASAMETQDQKPIEITIDNEGQIFIGETQVSFGRLLTVLSGVAQNDQEKRIYIRADTKLAYGQVMNVIGVLNKAGYRKVALITDPAVQTP